MDPKEMNEANEKRARQKLERKDYRMYVGVDTGARLMLGAVSRDAATGKTGQFTKYKSATYRQDVNDLVLKDRRVLLTKTTLEAKERDRRVFTLTDSLNHNGYRLTNTFKTELPPFDNVPASVDRHRIELSSMSWNYSDFTSFQHI